MARLSGQIPTEGLIVRKAATPADMSAVYSLRYDVFVDEMGGDGPMVDHEARQERDRFDDFAHHLMLIDESAGGVCIGTFRFMDEAGARAAGGFYTSGEYDLSPLLTSGARLLECGRSCLHPGHRGGQGMHLLWQALGQHVIEAGVDVLFGVASFPGRNPDPHKAAISHLHRAHLAPDELRPRALHPVFNPSDLAESGESDRLSVMRSMPSLIKAYLRLGGAVGEGAFVDDAFNTTDVCMVLPVANIPPAQRRRFAS